MKLALRGWRGILMLVALAIAFSPAPRTLAELQQPQKYTVEEYNDYQAAFVEKDVNKRVQLLDGFVKKYPSSELLPLVYQLYFQTYQQQNNAAKVVEYADKYLDYDKDSFAVLALRSYYFPYTVTLNDPQIEAKLNKADEMAERGLKALETAKKPDNVTEEQFAQQKKGATAIFHQTMGFVDLQRKDYKAAITHLRSAIEVSPDDPINFYRIGLAYIYDKPAQYLPGLWAIARAIDLKVPNAVQVREFLKKVYIQQQSVVGCPELIDQGISRLVDAAKQSAQPPADFKIFSDAEITAAREKMTPTSILTDLKVGGDTARLTWLAACGAGIELGGRVASATKEENSDDTILRLAVGPEAQSAPPEFYNVEVRVGGEPRAALLKQGDAVRFEGTVKSYQTDPQVVLQLVSGKVNEEDLPKAAPVKPKPKTPARRPAARRTKRG